MKNIFSKKNLNLFVGTLFIFGSTVQKVLAVDECVTLESAIKAFGDNDLVNNFNSQNYQNCCDYTEVTCSVINNEIHITGFKITNLNTFSSTGGESAAIDALSNLPYLTTLEISSSPFSKMPSNFDKLKNLKNLILSNNSYDGGLPEQVSRLSNLEKFDISKNYLNGNIPASYCQLKNLKHLILNGNRLTGTIPYCFKNLENLIELKLESNFDIEGYVPLIPNISSCNYQFTNLCSLKSSKCKTNISGCTEEKIKSTNTNNGNPDPNSGEFDNEVDTGNNKLSTLTSSYTDTSSKINDESDNIFNSFLRLFYTTLGLMILIPITIIVIIIIIIVCVVKKNEKNKKKRYNVLVANSNSQETTTETVNITYTQFVVGNTNNDSSSTQNEDDSTSNNPPPSSNVTANDAPPTPTSTYVQPPITSTPYMPQPVAGAAYVPQPIPTSYVAQPAYIPQPVPGAPYMPQPIPQPMPGYVPQASMPPVTPYPPAVPEPEIARCNNVLSLLDELNSPSSNKVDTLFFEMSDKWDRYGLKCPMMIHFFFNVHLFVLQTILISQHLDYGVFLAFQMAFYM